MLGFVDAVWNPDGVVIVGYGYVGSVHFWASDSGGGGGGGESDWGVELWYDNPCITGHFRGINDIDCEKTELKYLSSVGGSDMSLVE